MKVVAYGIQPSKKGILAQANHKQHDITLISNALSEETAFYAEGKVAVIHYSDLEVSSATLQLLANFGIKYVIQHSKSICFSGDNAAQFGIVWANIILSSFMVGVSYDSLQQAIDQTILLLNQWQSTTLDQA